MKNLAAYPGADANRRHTWLWPGGGAWGSNVLANGISVSLNKVPASAAAWTNAPFEAQYLKLFDVTPPPAPTTPIAAAYVIGTNVTFIWSGVTDSEGGIAGYHVLIGTTPGSSNVFNGVIATTSQTAAGSAGQTLYARVASVNNAGIASSWSAVTAGTILLAATADQDGDGMNNASEAVAATNPLDADSVLRLLSVSPSQVLTWASISGQTYQVYFATNLLNAFAPLSGTITASAPISTYQDAPATNAARWYRVWVGP